jgi:uncharacterized protein YbbK (DUF523 family)
MILVSACLAGVRCRHDGSHKLVDKIQKLIATRKAIPLCPEIMGGRPIPRPPTEIVGGTGDDVISGRAKILDKEGNDVTAEVMDGAKEFVKSVKRMEIKAVILKSKSPSCGYGKIYDGTFSGTLKDGNGVVAAMLEREGIKIYNEDNCEELIETL